MDVNNKFQHEGIKANKSWDVVAFLDISPNDFYVTFIHKNDFEFNIDVTKNGCIKKVGTVLLYDQKLNIHFRGKDGSGESATGVGYKVDFKLKDLKIVKTIKDIENLFLAMKAKN